MTEPYASVAGKHIVAMRGSVPWGGAWVIDATLDQVVDLSGSVDVVVGGMTLKGTIDPKYSGTFAFQSKVRVVAGGNGWRNVLPARAYHNDAGVKVLTVLLDLCAGCGETLLGVVAPAKERLGADFVRMEGPASRALSQIITPADWWVDYAGATNVGRRAQSEVSGDLTILDFDAGSKVATVVAPDPSVVGIGSILRDERLRAPLMVREITIELAGSALRLACWCKEVA